MAYKVFTNGSTLQASELNENLMQQSTAVFSNAAARTAAITSPVEGQLTYLEDTNQYQGWNGSAWVTESSGLILISSQSFTSANAVIFNDVFTSLYDSYQIVTSLTSAGAGHDAGFVLRVATVNAITNYQIAYVQTKTSVVNGFENLSGIAGQIGRFDTAGGLSVMTIHNPALAQRTFATINSVDSGMFTRYTSNMHTTATAYDGLQFNFNSATGSIRIYGLRKS